MHIWDCHTHIMPPDLRAARERLCRDEPWFGLLYANPTARLAGAEDLALAMDAGGVATALTFGFAFRDAGRCRACNDYVLQAARDAPGRVVPFAVVNPADPRSACAEARRCLESGAAGIGELMPDGQRFALDDGVLDAVLEVARAYHAPVLIHVNERLGHPYVGKGTQGPEEAYRLALRHPENVLIYAHWGGGLPFYELMPEVRAALHNVYYDTAASPLLYDDAIYRHAMAWAPSKVLFGSDYPLVAPARHLRRVRRAGLEPAGLAALLSDNARALFGATAGPCSPDTGGD
jgi:predicted TIM-barrel fold metal-dependent hydrolase